MLIAQQDTIVHAFSLILCFCRRLFVAFFRDANACRRCCGRTRRASVTTRASAAASPMTTKPPSPSAASAASPAGTPPSWPSPNTMASNLRRAARPQGTARQSGTPVCLRQGCADRGQAGQVRTTGRRPHRASGPAPSSAGGSAYRLPWAVLLARTFAVDVLMCPRCGAPRRLIAVITDPRVVRSILERLGLPPEPPPRAPARAPPQSTLDFPEPA